MLQLTDLPLAKYKLATFRHFEMHPVKGDVLNIKKMIFGQVVFFVFSGVTK